MKNPKSENTDITEIPENTKAPINLAGYFKLCFPILLFPLLYFPYTLWWRYGFAELAFRVLQGSGSQLVRLMLTGNNTILLFWCLVTVVVMLGVVVLAIFRVRPVLVIPIYIVVMFSLCGIFSLVFYSLILL